MKYPRWHELNVAYLNTNAVHTAHFVAIRGLRISAPVILCCGKRGIWAGKKAGLTFQTSRPEGRIVLADWFSGLKATEPSVAVSV